MMQPYGMAKLRAMILVLLVVVLAIMAYRLIPVYVDAFNFRDAMRTQAKFAAVDGKSPDAVREDLLRKARELDLPIEREQIEISKGPEGTVIATHFTVPVDLSFLVHDVEFNFRERGQ